MNNIDRFFDKNAEKFATSYLEYLVKLIKNIDTKQIANFIAIIMEARGKKIQFFLLVMAEVQQLLATLRTIFLSVQSAVRILLKL
jgi:hypothetical protein